MEYNELKEQVKEALFYTSALNNKQGNKYILPIIYTLYGKNRKPLYIGASQGIFDRLDWHSRKDYWKEVYTIGIRVYPDREQMRIAEIMWIFRKKPIYNRDANYNDNKEVLAFGMPGIEFKDNTEETIFRKWELVGERSFMQQEPGAAAG